MALGGGQACVDRRHLDVFLSRAGRDQVVALKHKTEGFAAQPGQFIAVEPGDVFSGEAVFARGRAIEAAKYVHQGRLAGTGGTHNRNEFTGMNRQVNTA
ncbi:hypothetical protein PS645_03522 [Pseudomonas fluorescens]|uniref:Uncharacterized protein n=1 Tax=Pseudomonas fluorescens TaxID=294 RepID=A0A5E6UYT8_PSEFL|nr:hypothetical protein PS645_03522 [Pseudomonas fluorescens]